MRKKIVNTWIFQFNAQRSLDPEQPENYEGSSYEIVVSVEANDLNQQQADELRQQLNRMIRKYHGTKLNLLPEFEEKLPDNISIAEALFCDMIKGTDELGDSFLELELRSSPFESVTVGEQLVLGENRAKVSPIEYISCMENLERKYGQSVEFTAADPDYSTE